MLKRSDLEGLRDELQSPPYPTRWLVLKSEMADYLTALLDRWPEGAELRTGWQPIETAPREIEFRCLLGHRWSVVTGYWDGNGWRNERGPRDSYFPASHWMPLPPRPEAPDDRG